MSTIILSVILDVSFEDMTKGRYNDALQRLTRTLDLDLEPGDGKLWCARAIVYKQDEPLA